MLHEMREQSVIRRIMADGPHKGVGDVPGTLFRRGHGRGKT